MAWNLQKFKSSIGNGNFRREFRIQVLLSEKSKIHRVSCSKFMTRGEFVIIDGMAEIIIGRRKNIQGAMITTVSKAQKIMQEKMLSCNSSKCTFHIDHKRMGFFLKCFQISCRQGILILLLTIHSLT